MENPKILQTGNWLRGDALYIERAADKKILKYIESGKKLICLSEPHQSGKTSLSHRICDKLQREGVYPAAYIDLQTIISHGASEIQCYFSIAKKINKEFGLSNDGIKAFWESTAGEDPKGFCENFFKSLSALNKKVVILIDEVGFIQSSDSGFDGFFSSIAQTENICFILSGIFTTHYICKKSPSFKNLKKTFLPLNDFNRKELKKFTDILEEYTDNNGEQILDDIYKWTDGQPYMSQKICEAVITRLAENVDKIVEELFLKNYIYSEVSISSINSNFNNFIEEQDRREIALLIYEKLLKSEDSLSKAELLTQFSKPSVKNEDVLEDMRVCGLISIDGKGKIKPKNLICRTVFNENWINQQRNSAM